MTTDDTTSVPQYAAHADRITLSHADTEPHPQLGSSGATTYWADGTTSYVLHFRSGQVHGWTMADEADTAIHALDSLRAGEEMSKEALASALRDTRRLMTRLTAVQDELTLYAREDGPAGTPRMSWRAIGEEVGLHFSTVRERHGRMVAGDHAEWRYWLTQDTPRAAMYGGSVGLNGRRTTPTLREQAEEAAALSGGTLLAEAIPMDPGGYVITVTDYSVEPHQLARIDLPDWNYFRAPSAGHRLIEHDYQVLPAAHYEPDRAAGWKPGPDGLTYSAPVYRLPQNGDEA